MSNMDKYTLYLEKCYTTIMTAALTNFIKTVKETKNKRKRKKNLFKFERENIKGLVFL